MRRNQALPSNYLSKEDFPKPVQAEVAEVIMEKMPGDGKMKPVVYIRNASDRELDVERGIILNGTNWDAIAEMRGEDPNETETDRWIGTLIVIFNDPNVSFGGKRTGGIRIRAPKSAQPVARKPAPAAVPPDDEPPPPDDDYNPDHESPF